MRTPEPRELTRDDRDEWERADMLSNPEEVDAALAFTPSLRHAARRQSPSALAAYKRMMGAVLAEKSRPAPKET